MKITFVTSTLTSGGSERVISILANELNAKGYEVSIILLNEPLVFYKVNEAVKLHFAQNHSSNIVGKMLWLRNHIKRENPDVVIPFMTAVFCTTILSLIGLNYPIISSERIDPAYSSRVRKILRWILLPFTTHLVVQTQRIKEYYSKRIQEKTTIIPNPVSENVFNIKSELIKQKRIISVGRLYEQKNQRLMIDAFADLSNKFPEYSLVIYGEGPLREELTNYIKEKGLQEKIFLPGRTEHIIDELSQSEIFCLSSDYEGMSNALLEAMCIGLPIVTTRVSGVDDMLVDKENAYIVNIKDKDALVAALEKLMSDKCMREKFESNNKIQAEKYTIERIVREWELLIEKIVLSK